MLFKNKGKDMIKPLDKNNSALLKDIIAVSNRNIAESSMPGSFLTRIEDLCKTNVKAIILREKDLNETDYLTLAKSVFNICLKYNKKLILHSYPEVALKLGINSIHMPLELLRTKPSLKEQFSTIGTSVHSISDVIYANEIGVSYIIAGHIFETDCKKGLTPRGLDFLSDIVSIANMPVYAIGGISFDNLDEVLKAGAKGACMMSSLMREKRS